MTTRNGPHNAGRSLLRNRGGYLCHGRYWARSKLGSTRLGDTQADFLGGLQDVLGEEDDEPPPLCRTAYDSVDAQIQHAVGRQLAGEEDGDSPTPAALAKLLRALADVLDGGQAQCWDND